MQGAETKEARFPCGRRVHLYRSVCFKTIFEQIPPKNDAGIDPEMIEQSFRKHQNHDAKNKIKIYYPKYPNFEMLAPILEPFAWPFHLVAHLFRNLFLGTTGGYPLGPIWHPMGHPWSDLVINLLEDCRNYAPNCKYSRAPNGTNHTFRTNKSKHILKHTSKC